MKSLQNIILEKLRLGKDTKVKDVYEIDVLNSNKTIKFEKSNNDKFNNVFEWVCKHCNIDLNAYNECNVGTDILQIILDCNKIESNSATCVVFPNDKRLTMQSVIHTECDKLNTEYKNKNIDIFGTLVPWKKADLTKYGQLVFTSTGIYYIFKLNDDYPIKISNETF